MSLIATTFSVFSASPQSIIEEKPDSIFISLTISSTVATTFRTLVKVPSPFLSNLFLNEQAKKSDFFRIPGSNLQLLLPDLFWSWHDFSLKFWDLPMFYHIITNYDRTTRCWHWVRSWLVCGRVLFWVFCWISCFSIYFIQIFFFKFTFKLLWKVSFNFRFFLKNFVSILGICYLFTYSRQL